MRPPAHHLWITLASLPLGVAPAYAGGVRGRVVITAPVERRQEPRPLGYWRLENGRLPIQSVAPTARRQALVVLEPAELAALVPQTITLDAAPGGLEPRFLVATLGSRLIVRNSDKRSHTLYLQGGESFMPRRTLAVAEAREVRLISAGQFLVRDADDVAAATTLLVLGTPYFARCDGRGEFKLDLPDGKYTLKAFVDGSWSAGQAVDVPALKTPGAPPPKPIEVVVRMTPSERSAAP